MTIDQTVTTIESLTIAAAAAGMTVQEFVEPQDQHVILNAMRFHYLDWGLSGPPVLWLHGGALTAHTYDLVCLALRPEYTCVALDQRGHGDSEWSPVADYSVAAYAADVASLADHLNWHRFVLIGMSMGGINAMHYAGSHSDRLAALVLIDVGPEVRSTGANRIHDFTKSQVLDSVEEFVTRAMEFNPRRDPRLLRMSVLHNLRQRPDGRWTWKWDPRPREERANRSTGLDDARRVTQLWEDVDRIICPTLVVRGEESDVFLTEDAERLVSRLKDGRWTTIPNSGHTVPGDNPAALVIAVTDFLAEIAY